MEDIIKGSIEAYKSFWNNWGSRNPKRVEIIKGLIHEDFRGFGSNIDEVWESYNDLFLQLDKEANQILEPYLVDFKWIECHKIDKDSTIAYGVISLKIKIKKKTILLETVRNSIAFLKVNNEIKIKHWHCSLPDIGVGGEVVPGALEPKRHNEVSVMFCDFVNFTETAAKVLPRVIFNELSDIYQNFDEITDELGLEKIQVYGDGYLAICGLLEKDAKKHAVRCIEAGKIILSYLRSRNESSELQWHARIGIHSGPLIAGIIGERKFSFNIFGDTVNTAARIESASITDKINVSQTTYELAQTYFDFEHRGKIETKGKGEIDMYFVL
jgi:class 3 adenylate cyclase